jgi:signal peptidase I
MLPKLDGVKRAWKLGAPIGALVALFAIGLQIVVVPTASMEGTVLVGDHLLIDRLAYGPQIPFTHLRLPRLRKVRRGDVVSFHPPYKEGEVYLKRVVARGGDSVESRAGELYINGTAQGARFSAAQSFTVPADELYMLGDNRDHSEDSRAFGSVPEANVIGEPIVVLWSFADPSERWLQSQVAVYFDHPFERLRWERFFREVK